MIDLGFYKGKSVFITGHTGFKGSWLTKILVDAGAEVTGYSLTPPTDPCLFNLICVKDSLRSVIGDIRDFDHLYQAFNDAEPEIVFHLAAQPIVKTSYKQPLLTYETNVIGTVNILECVRKSNSVRSVLNVTTDKVYENKEWCWGYRENEPLDGYDPYSNSKSCSELVTHSYKKSFLDEAGIAVSTARAGNVVGGGDFANDRIVPDCIRAAISRQLIVVRNPHSIRPYQHVLEALSAYLMIAAYQYKDIRKAGYYNVGPDEPDCITTEKLVSLFCKDWGDGISWISQNTRGPHEANFLRLDCSKIKSMIGWTPHWNTEIAIKKTIDWTKVWLADPGKVPSCMEEQIEEFMSLG